MQKDYWQKIETTQFLEGINHLEKKLWERGRSGMLIANTGLGKTYLIERFTRNKKITAFKVTCSKGHKLKDILNDILDLLDLSASSYDKHPHNLTEKEKVDVIIREMTRLQANGKKPIIILDESENVDISVLKTIKTLYDALNNICALVLIGTQELVDKILNKASRHRNGLPQLWRRVKAGTKVLSPLNKYVDFPVFFETFNVKDPALQQLLIDHADNYGELHDRLEPLLIEADQKNLPLNEDLFREYWGIKKEDKKFSKAA